MHPQDRYTPWTIIKTVPEMTNATLVSECDEELYCGLPFYAVRHHKQANMTYWLPFSKPEFPSIPIFKLKDMDKSIKNLTKFQFTIKDPTDHMGLYISPEIGVKLVSWTFGRIPKSSIKWKGRNVHYVNFIYGTDNSDIEFYLELESTTPRDGPLISVTLVAHYMHHEEYRTEKFKSFIEKFPKFIHVVAYQSHLQSWAF